MTNPTPHGQVPEALRLAQELDAVPETGADPQTIQEAAAELRRLHAYCQELEAQVILDCMTHIQNPAPQPSPEALRAAPNASYSPEDRAFHQFWYSHMFEDLMQPPLIGIPHSTARYIWDAALRTAHVQKPAEIEHVAWDVSKNGAEMNTTGAVHADEQAAFEAVAKADTWHGWKLRASHGQASAQAAPVRGSPADLPPLPDPDLRDVGTTPGGIKEFLRGYATEYAKAALAARAPADSVLEDAARLDFLIEQRAYVVSDPDTCPGYWLHFVHKETGKCWAQCDEHPTPRAAIDAARKQGANHD